MLFVVCRYDLFCGFSLRLHYLAVWPGIQGENGLKAKKFLRHKCFVGKDSPKVGRVLTEKFFGICDITVDRPQHYVNLMLTVY